MVTGEVEIFDEVLQDNLAHLTRQSAGSCLVGELVSEITVRLKESLQG
jgi:hypothetical protein